MPAASPESGGYKPVRNPWPTVECGLPGCSERLRMRTVGSDASGSGGHPDREGIMGTDDQFCSRAHRDRYEGGPPARIQRKRVAGWRMPAGAVYVGRPTMWGNEFAVGEEVTLNVGGNVSTFVIHDRVQAVNLFASWQASTLAYAARRDLAGFDLVCWCPLDQPCHADVLLRIANATESVAEAVSADA